MQEEWRRGESDADAVVGAARFVWSAARGGSGRRRMPALRVGGEMNNVDEPRAVVRDWGSQQQTIGSCTYGRGRGRK